MAGWQQPLLFTYSHMLLTASRLGHPSITAAIHSVCGYMQLIIAFPNYSSFQNMLILATGIQCPHVTGRVNVALYLNLSPHSPPNPRELQLYLAHLTNLLRYPLPPLPSIWYTRLSIPLSLKYDLNFSPPGTFSWYLGSALKNYLLTQTFTQF